MAPFRTLTFDLFGTVLDLGGSLTPYIRDYLEEKKCKFSPEEFWSKWRERQRIEQFRDTIMMLGHCGYLEAARRALKYVFAQIGIPVTNREVAELMEAWRQLKPFPEVEEALNGLKEDFQLVVLSNGERDFLKYLVENRCPFGFDRIISVDEAGAFKPHPAVYRKAAQLLKREPGECLMVSAHPFDVVGARACGFRGAFVNRYGFPYIDDRFLPDLEVQDFSELARELM